jgi:methylthioribose-1-phosphate isomerase
VIADNAGGHLMQRGQVDLVSSSAATASPRNGDVCNKIGTYLKALAARDNGVPFYVAMPLSTLDLALSDGLRRSRSRSAARASDAHRRARARRRMVEVQLAPDGSAAANPAFDVTPARLVSALITERGVVAAGPRPRCGPGRSGCRMTSTRTAAEQAAVAAMRRLDALGLNRGSTGNLSLAARVATATAC